MVVFVAKKIIPVDVETLKILGIDEISLVKGQEKFIVVLVDLETHKLVGLVPYRTQSQIQKVMQQYRFHVTKIVHQELNQARIDKKQQKH